MLPESSGQDVTNNSPPPQPARPARLDLGINRWRPSARRREFGKAAAVRQVGLTEEPASERIRLSNVPPRPPSSSLKWAVGVIGAVLGHPLEEPKLGKMLIRLVPEEGIEPTHPLRIRDFESRASASSATPAGARTTIIPAHLPDLARDRTRRDRTGPTLIRARQFGASGSSADTVSRRESGAYTRPPPRARRCRSPAATTAARRPGVDT
jgi:hypothetical protein